MNHFASPDFWFYYRQLPPEIRDLADKNFELLKQDLRHPSLRLKKVGIFYSARVGLHYRALAKERSEGFVWFWIGHHSEYDRLLGG
ncbi:MAG: type II toxin-antitoxin system RelE family toxin [Sphaerospermopsis kisseleviana]